MSERRDRAAEILVEAKFRVETKLGEIWWIILSRGVLALCLALCAFVWPQQTLGLLIKLLGAYLMVDGILWAVGAYHQGNIGSTLMQAIVSFAMGCVLLFWTGVSAKFFLIFIGIWLVLQGVGLFLSSRRVDPEEGERGLIAIIGGIMVLIGIVFVVWTDTGIVAISWLLGIAATIVGCLLVYLATRVRKLQTRMVGLGERIPR